MNPSFFFLGKLSREESASAFLATLLDQREDFRTFFFKILGIEEPQSTCQVSIEQKDIDIRLDYPSAKVVFLIENKIRPGAVQINQLLRYYLQERTANAELRILSILIAPSEGTGTIETTRLTGHKEFRKADAVYSISWRELVEFCDLLKQDDRHAEFVKGGFRCISKMIDDAAQEKYPLIGGREIAHDVAQSVFRVLSQEFPKIRFGFWRGKDRFTIYSIGTDITVYVALAFQVENKVPYAPLGIPDRQHVTAILRTQFTLSAKGKRNNRRREEWDRIYRNGEYDVPDIGLHRLAGRWLKREFAVCGETALLERQLLEMGRSVIKRLTEFL